MSTIQRIRYIKAGLVLRSFRKFSVDGTDYLLELNPLTKTAYLLNAKDNSVVKEGRTNGGLHKLKIVARKLLEETGIDSAREDRAKRVPSAGT